MREKKKYMKNKEQRASKAKQFYISVTVMPGGQKGENGGRNNI